MHGTRTALPGYLLNHPPPLCNRMERDPEIKFLCYLKARVGSSTGKVLTP